MAPSRTRAGCEARRRPLAARCMRGRAAAVRPTVLPAVSPCRRVARAVLYRRREEQMIPMIDTMLVPGVTAILNVSPLFLGLGVTLVAGAVLLARGVSEELRRVAAREWDARNIRVTTPERERAAA